MYLVVARKNSGSAITVDGNTATLGEGLKNSLDLHSDLNSETSDGIDLCAVVGGIGINGGVHIDSVAPCGIDLLDGSADVEKEGTVAVVGALASIGEVPLEVHVGHAESVLESPGEGAIRHILEALEIHPINVLGDSTSPIILVINNSLTFLDDLPHLLADGNDLIDVDIIMNGSGEIGGSDAVQTSGSGVGLFDCTKSRAGQSDGGDTEIIVICGECDASNNNKSKNSTHLLIVL